MFVCRTELVGKWMAPYTLATFPLACGVPSLEHEPLDVSVKDGSVVVVGGCQGQKVLRGLRNSVTKYPDIRELDMKLVTDAETYSSFMLP